MSAPPAHNHSRIGQPEVGCPRCEDSAAPPIVRDADGLEDCAEQRAARAMLTWEPSSKRSPTPEELRDTGRFIERYGTPIAQLMREPCVCSQADYPTCSPATDGAS